MHEFFRKALEEDKKRMAELDKKLDENHRSLQKLQTSYSDLSERFTLALRVMNQLHDAIAPLLEVTKDYRHHIDPEQNDWVARNYNHRKSLMIAQAEEALRYFDYFKDATWGTKTYIG